MRLISFVTVAVIVLMFVLLPFALAQNEQGEGAGSASPVFTGFAAPGITLFPSEKKFDFGFNPVLLVPVGKEGLFLMEWELEYSLERENRKTEREFEYGLEYLQFNQPLFKRLTAVFGKFLTPAMWNERLHPAWIKKTPNAPFTAGLFSGSGTGFMLRGAMPLDTDVNLTYASFFTVPISNKYFSSERMIGGRIGTFFKKQGLDLGLFAARLKEETTNLYGADFTYQLRDQGFDFRGEYYNGHDGSAYWVEAAKRFKDASVFLKRFELTARFERAFVPSRHHHEEEEEHHHDEGEHHEDDDEGDHNGDDHHDGEMPEIEKGHGDEGHHGVFPEANTNRFIGTLNYYIRDGFKLYFSYGREVLRDIGLGKTSWSFGLAFRFLK